MPFILTQLPQAIRARRVAFIRSRSVSIVIVIATKSDTLINVKSPCMPFAAQSTWKSEVKRLLVTKHCHVRRNGTKRHKAFGLGTCHDWRLLTPLPPPLPGERSGNGMCASVPLSPSLPVTVCHKCDSPLTSPQWSVSHATRL